MLRVRDVFVQLKCSYRGLIPTDFIQTYFTSSVAINLLLQCQWVNLEYGGNSGFTTISQRSDNITKTRESVTTKSNAYQIH